MNEPVIAQKGPYLVDVEAGRTYRWCACGKSTRQPFCDNVHTDDDPQPVIWKADSSGKKGFCGCKKTNTPPLCDGTHTSL